MGKNPSTLGMENRRTRLGQQFIMNQKGLKSGNIFRLEFPRMLKDMPEENIRNRQGWYRRNKESALSKGKIFPFI